MQFQPKADWKNIDWAKYTTSEIAENFNVTYSAVIYHRKRYAPETIRPMKSWKHNVILLINNKKRYIIANNFKQQAAIRTTAYYMNYTLRSKIIGKKWHMFKGHKINKG